jgi:glucose-6-phosphate 1-dehydrogenase
MHNGTIIIFGGSGDLSVRKLIPALYHLAKKGNLKSVAIIGVALEDIDAHTVLERVRPHVDDFDEAAWRCIQENFYYHALNFTHYEHYESLTRFVQEIEQKRSLSGNRLVYLATAAHFFCTITEYLGKSELVSRKKPEELPWHRIVYEKPFGKDIKSAHEINACIKNWFEECQIYRVDHYLTKELVNNITLLRFTNIVFEPIWSNTYIDQVHIVLSETSSVGNRGMYYDHYGALRDVVQNHMLELLALVAMEAPEKLTGDFIRTERVKVLEKVRMIDGILGQYDAYTHEESVPAHSTTETFAALHLTVDNARWKDVPFYLKTGKCLDKDEVAIYIKFKQVACRLTKNCPSDSNWLTIRVSPDASFILMLNAKKPGRSDELMTVAMEFCHSCLYATVTPDAHEVLFEEIWAGEQTASVRFDEIESAWKIVDAIYAKHLPLYHYARASEGPKELEDFYKRHNISLRI